LHLNIRLKNFEYGGEARACKPGRIADQLSRLDFLILDELGYLPFAQSERREAT
jgi:DNA replication protein DnaC